MYISAISDEQAVTVGVLSGSAQDDADYQAVIDEITATNRAASARRRASVFVLVVHREVPAAPAVWRKRFSVVHKELPHAPHYFVLVTENAAARGVFTAVTWLTGTPPGHVYKAMGSVRDADRWLATELGEQSADIVHLETKARLVARRGADGSRGHGARSLTGDRAPRDT